MGNISYYIFVLIALMVAFLVVKKVASCMIKTVVLLVMVVALAVIYYLYLGLTQFGGRLDNGAELIEPGGIR